MVKRPRTSTVALLVIWLVTLALYIVLQPAEKQRDPVAIVKELTSPPETKTTTVTTMVPVPAPPGG